MGNLYISVWYSWGYRNRVFLHFPALWCMKIADGKGVQLIEAEHKRIKRRTNTLVWEVFEAFC